MKQRGFIIPPMVALYGFAAAGVVIALLSAALWFSNGRLDACREAKATLQAQFNTFKREVKAAGELAAAEAHAEMLRDRTWKELNDAKTAESIAVLRAANQRLRNDRDRTRRSVVPAAPAGARDPETACFKRSELERAMGQSLQELRDAVDGIVEAGDEARVNLDGAKKWAQKP